EMCSLLVADSLMVPLGPGLERGDRAGNRLLAHLHPPADAAVLEVCISYEVLLAGNDAGRQTSQEFVRGVERHISAGRDHAAKIVLGCCIDDHGNAAAVRHFAEGLQRYLPVLHYMV